MKTVYLLPGSSTEEFEQAVREVEKGQIEPMDDMMEEPPPPEQPTKNMSMADKIRLRMEQRRKNL